MRRFIVFGLLLVLLQLAAPFAAGNRLKRAAYFMNNNPAGETVIAISISPETGLLSSTDITNTSTGGFGLLGSLGPAGSSGPDSLFGQDSVVVGGDLLFTVNPGSHTLSMFYINPEDPLNLTLVGAPADTLGEFPMSVAYSADLQVACTLNGGAVSGVTCFSVTSNGLITKETKPRSVAEAVHQTTPPLALNGTTSDVFFNPSSTALFVLIKGNTTVNNTEPGYFYVWPVEDGEVSQTPVISRVGDIFLAYSGSFLRDDSRFLVTDPATGIAIVDVSQSFEITQEVHTVIPGNLALCWSIYSPTFDTVYTFDSKVQYVTMIDPSNGDITGVIPFDQGVNATLVGAFDVAIDRKWMYFLDRDASITVVDLLGTETAGMPSVVQKLNLTSLGSRKAWEGMAIYPASYY